MLRYSLWFFVLLVGLFTLLAIERTYARRAAMHRACMEIRGAAECEVFR